MAENMIKFLRGNVADLPQTATAGALYFTKDEGVYLGLENGSYHRYGDFITVSDVASLPKAGAHQNCMYYCVAENILAKWDGKQWVQINKQKTLAELGGVAKSVYEAKIANLEQADTNNATAIDGVDTRLQAAEKKLMSVATTEGLSELTNRVSTAEGEINDLQAAIADGGSVANAIAAAKKAGDDAKAAADTAQATANSKITMAEVEAKNYATKTEAQGYADAKDSAIAAAKKAGDDAQADVDALETKVGAVPENKTVVQMIADAQEAATYDDTAVKASIKAIADDYLKAADKTELQGNIDTVSGKVTTLIGSVEGDNGKSARTIASEEVAKIVAGADASYDTLKEISDWISSHKDDASAMNSAIIALEGIVDGIGGDGEKATVVAYVTDAIAALNIGDYAKAADLDAHTGDTTVHITAEERTKWNTAEGKAHTHSNKALLDTYTQTEENLADAVAKKHSHANAAELDKIADGNVAKWNAAQANAEATAAAALSSAKSDLEGKITAAQAAAEGKVTELANGAVKTNTDDIATLKTGKANKATTLAGYGITDAYTKTETYTKAEVESMLTWGSF